MEKSKIEVGMHVTISKDISKTQKVHGLGSGMPGMAGRTFKVEDIRRRSEGVVIRINDYSWHPDDLTEVSTEKKSEPFHFNIKELSI